METSAVKFGGREWYQFVDIARMHLFYGDKMNSFLHHVPINKGVLCQMNIPPIHLKSHVSINFHEKHRL